MKRLRFMLALGAFFVLGIALSGCGSGLAGDEVASVAGNPISLRAFDHWMYIAAKGNSSQSPGSPVIVPNDPPAFKGCISQVRQQIPSFAKGKTDAQIKTACNQLFQSLSGQVMDFLIRSYWYQADAARQHVKVSNAQIQQAFESARRQQFPTEAAFHAFLAQSGQTLQDIMFRVRVNQIYVKLLAKHKSSVTSAQIQSYYTNHPSQFGTPESRDIRLVRTNSATQAAAAAAALKSGQSWAAVAKRYSVDTATKSSGGLLRHVSRGQEEQALDKAAFSSAPHKLIGPVHGQFGYYVIEVVAIHPAKKQSLAQATPLIRQILAGRAQSGAQSTVDAVAKKHWLHQTKCRSQYAMADCDGYKPPKTSAATTTTH